MDATMEQSSRPSRAPMSGLAITGFVLVFVMGFISLTGMWWLNVVPLLFALFAWMGISAGKRRGGGFVIATVVLSLLASVGVYLMWKGIATLMEQGLGKYVAALDKGDDAELTKWVPPGEDVAATIGRWKERMAKAHDAAGNYADSTTIRSGWFGPLVSMVLPPEGVEEVDGGGAKPVLGGKTVWMWFQAKFAKSPLWVALEINQGGADAMKEHAGEDRIAIFRDVRFFRAAGP